MNTTTAGSTAWTATLDHRTGATLVGGPASRYHRVARCDGRSDARGARWSNARPNYAARRLGALLVALSAVMAGTWLVGEVAAGQPASAASADVEQTGDVATATSDVHVAREGDTLWSIADPHRGDVGRDRFVDALVDLNGGTSIHIGQAVRLP